MKSSSNLQSPKDLNQPSLNRVNGTVDSRSEGIPLTDSLTVPTAHQPQQQQQHQQQLLERSLSNASPLHLIKKGTTLQVIRGFIADYSDATSIHGIKYFGARKKHWCERIVWFAMVCASMYCCVTLTLQTWDNWNNHPVIVSLAESSTPIWQIPFPAVTICPLVKYRDELNYKLLLQEFMESSRNFSAEELSQFNAISNVCLTNTNYLKQINFTNNYAEELLYGGFDMLETLRNAAPQANETLENIRWRDIALEGSDTGIKEIITGDGLCFSFNTLDDSQIFRNHNPENSEQQQMGAKMSWSLEDGYSSKSGTRAYPRRVLAGDNDESFHVLVKARLRDNDPGCSGKSEGFKVILHTPDEFPQVSKRFFLVPFAQIISVAVKPNMITTTPVVRSYPPEKRQCFFNNERYLKYFKIYTQGNCEHECLSNATLKSCGCSKFSQQKDDDTKFCGAAKIECYRRARKDILKYDGYKKVCNCLPSCTSVAYDTEVTQSMLNPILNETNELMWETAQSTMKIFFASNQFLSAKRSELYGIADLIANIGGLFGLFMGVSILSLVEIVYFCTFRMYVNMEIRKKTKKKKRASTASVSASVSASASEGNDLSLTC